MQEVFVLVFCVLGGVWKVDVLSGWICVIVRNTVIDHFWCCMC